jgi:hypothetical protein
MSERKYCEQCNKAQGAFQICNGDGRIHGHGMIHVLDGGLKWVCDYCAIQDKKAWERRKKQLAQARQVIDI